MQRNTLAFTAHIGSVPKCKMHRSKYPQDYLFDRFRLEAARHGFRKRLKKLHEQRTKVLLLKYADPQK